MAEHIGRFRCTGPRPNGAPVRTAADRCPDRPRGKTGGWIGSAGCPASSRPQASRPRAQVRGTIPDTPGPEGGTPLCRGRDDPGHPSALARTPHRGPGAPRTERSGREGGRLFAGNGLRRIVSADAGAPGCALDGAPGRIGRAIGWQRRLADQGRDLPNRSTGRQATGAARPHRGPGAPRTERNGGEGGRLFGGNGLRRIASADAVRTGRARRRTRAHRAHWAATAVPVAGLSAGEAGALQWARRSPAGPVPITSGAGGDAETDPSPSRRRGRAADATRQVQATAAGTPGRRPAPPADRAGGRPAALFEARPRGGHRPAPRGRRGRVLHRQAAGRRRARPPGPAGRPAVGPRGPRGGRGLARAAPRPRPPGGRPGRRPRAPEPEPDAPPPKLADAPRPVRPLPAPARAARGGQAAPRSHPEGDVLYHSLQVFELARADALTTRSSCWPRCSTTSARRSTRPTTSPPGSSRSTARSPSGPSG